MAMSDMIESLPTDRIPPSESELKLMDNLFKKEQSNFEKFLEGSADVLLVGFLFVIFSLPEINQLIVRVIPVAGTSPYINVCIRGAFVMLVYLVIKNIHLARK
jgi:hypothetical protein